MSKKAVVIGCDYRGTVSELHGAVNDAYVHAQILLKFGFIPEAILFLVDRDRERNEETPLERRPTKENILRGLSWLADTSQAGDILYVAFAGIGTQSVDKASEDEDAMYEALCPSDFDLPDADGFPFRLIHDREIRAVLKRVHPQAMLTCMWDCNHGSTFLDAAHKLDGTNNRAGPVTRPRGFLARTRDSSTWTGNRTCSRPRFLPALPVAKLLPPVPPSLEPRFHFSFSAARDDQASLEVHFGRPNETQGLLTKAFAEAVQNLRLNCSYEQLFERMNEYLNMLRTNADLCHTNQFIQLCWPNGVDPAEEKFLGVPSLPQDQEMYMRNWNYPMTTKSRAFNQQLRTARIPYPTAPGGGPPLDPHN